MINWEERWKWLSQLHQAIDRCDPPLIDQLVVIRPSIPPNKLSTRLSCSINFTDNKFQLPIPIDGPIDGPRIEALVIKQRRDDVDDGYWLVSDRSGVPPTKERLQWEVPYLQWEMDTRLTVCLLSCCSSFAISGSPFLPPTDTQTQPSTTSPYLPFYWNTTANQ